MKIKAIPKEPPTNSKFWSSHRSGKVIAQSFLEREVTIQNYEAICSVKTDHSIMHRLKNNWYCPNGLIKKCDTQTSETQIPMKRDRSASSGMKNPTNLATASVLSRLRNQVMRSYICHCRVIPSTRYLPLLDHTCPGLCTMNTCHNNVINAL